MEPDALLRTERLDIRPWRLDDVDRHYDLYRRTEVTRWLGGPALGDREQAAALIERMTARLAVDPRFGSWAIVERSTGAPAGSVLLKPVPDGEGEMEIGWHLHPDRWGRGYASEAAAAVLAHGFASGLEEVWAVVHPDNRRSVAVCQRIGMRLLGVTHRWYHQPLLMFWAGARAGQEPSLGPDHEAPAALSAASTDG